MPMNNAILRTFTITVRRPTGLRDGLTIDTQEVVQVEIDLSRIAAVLGAKAARSKTRRSGALSGMVKVRALGAVTTPA